MTRLRGESREEEFLREASRRDEGCVGLRRTAWECISTQINLLNCHCVIRQGQRVVMELSCSIRCSMAMLIVGEDPVIEDGYTRTRHT